MKKSRISLVKSIMAFALTIALVVGAVLFDGLVNTVQANEPKAMTNETLTWSGAYTVSNDVWMNGNVTVTGDTTITIAEGVTLGLSDNTITIAEGKTLTVAGKGKLYVCGKAGLDGTAYVGETSPATDGSNAPVALSGKLKVLSGTVEIKGGNGGQGGADYITDNAGKGGNGGSGIKGSVIVEDGIVTIIGGQAGNGGEIGDLSTGEKGDGGSGVDGDVIVRGGVYPSQAVQA